MRFLTSTRFIFCETSRWGFVGTPSKGCFGNNLCFACVLKIGNQKQEGSRSVYIHPYRPFLGVLNREGKCFVWTKHYLKKYYCCICVHVLANFTMEKRLSCCSIRVSISLKLRTVAHLASLLVRMQLWNKSWSGNVAQSHQIFGRDLFVHSFLWV